MVYLETYPLYSFVFSYFFTLENPLNCWYETIEGSSDPPTKKIQTYFHQASQKSVS